MNLLNTVQGMLTGGVVDKLASLVGGNSSLIKTGLTSALPSLLKGIISKGSSAAGAGQLLDMIKNNNLTANMTPDNALLDKGAALNESIFGSALKDINIPGVSGSQRSGLLNAATPMVMGSLGKIVKDRNLDAAGFSSFLNDQKSSILGAVSGAGIANSVRETVSHTSEKSSGGLGFLKFLLPLLLIAAAAWWFLNKDKGTAEASTSTATETTASTSNSTSSSTATHTHADGTVHSGHSHGDATSTTTTSTTTSGTSATGNVSVAGFSLDAAGNLLKDGELYLKKGEFTVKDGEYFDADGKSLGFIGKVGKAIGDAGKAVGGAVGDAGKAVGGAVGGAAEKTADFFKDTFGGMFKKKSEGTAVAAYSLSKISFDSESHKISSFSKNEVQGLAAALKAYPDSKITVKATGADKKTTKMRAQVIHDMLVTLGVADKQIDAEGAGEGAEAYSIVIN